MKAFLILAVLSATTLAQAEVFNIQCSIYNPFTEEVQVTVTTIDTTLSTVNGRHADTAIADDNIVMYQLDTRVGCPKAHPTFIYDRHTGTRTHIRCSGAVTVSEKACKFL